MTINHAVNHAAEGPLNLEVPLAGFSQCHLGIVSQLQAFAELPALQAAAEQARNIAAKTLALFKYSVYGHFADEENELFPAVLRSAAQGEEADRVQAMVQRLTTEHRAIESLWKKLEPVVKAAAKAKPGELDLVAVEELVQAFLAHANFEEQQFLPLAETILSRNGNHMAALGLSLHMRHAPLVVGYV
jgi:hemerythrin-like domain-containing protein